MYKQLAALGSLFLVSGCGNMDIASAPISTIRVENVFSLATHKQTGSCTELPIAHRFISFQPIEFAMEGTDVFVGVLDVALDQNTKTYEAVYKELPGIGNTNTVSYSTRLTGSYDVSEVNDQDILELENLGTVTPSVTYTKVSFQIHLAQAIHRTPVKALTAGVVRNSSTEIFSDNCPP